MFKVSPQKPFQNIVLGHGGDLNVKFRIELKFFPCIIVGHICLVLRKLPLKKSHILWAGQFNRLLNRINLECLPNPEGIPGFPDA